MDEELRELYSKGKELFNSKKYEAALELFERFVKKNEHFADVFNFLGLIYHDLGRFDDAITNYEKALAINPKYTDAALNLMVMLNDTGKYNQAREIGIRISEASVSEDEQQVVADNYARGKLANMHCEIADVYSSMGIYDEAIDEYGKALRLQPEYVDIQTKLGIAQRESGNAELAIESLKKALTIRSQYPSAWLHLGLSHYVLKQNDQAREAWQKVIEIVPGHKSAATYLHLLDEKSK
jgi:tetratricopeptide (TPR) repeat protein